MAKPIHMMVRVRDEERSVDFYRRAFGLEIAQRVDFPDFTLIYMREPAGGFEVVMAEGFAHIDVVTAEDNDDNPVPAALVAFLKRNVQ